MADDDEQLSKQYQLRLRNATTKAHYLSILQECKQIGGFDFAKEIRTCYAQIPLLIDVTIVEALYKATIEAGHTTEAIVQENLLDIIAGRFANNDIGNDSTFDVFFAKEKITGMNKGAYEALANEGAQLKNKQLSRFLTQKHKESMLALSALYIQFEKPSQAFRDKALERCLSVKIGNFPDEWKPYMLNMVTLLTNAGAKADKGRIQAFFRQANQPSNKGIILKSVASALIGAAIISGIVLTCYFAGVTALLITIPLAPIIILLSALAVSLPFMLGRQNNRTSPNLVKLPSLPPQAAPGPRPAREERVVDELPTVSQVNNRSRQPILNYVLPLPPSIGPVVTAFLPSYATIKSSLTSPSLNLPAYPSTAPGLPMAQSKPPHVEDDYLPPVSTYTRSAKEYEQSQFPPQFRH